MKQIVSYGLMVIGILLLAYFGYVFVLFNSTDDPTLLPFVPEPVLYSIGFMVLGIVLAVFGVWLRHGARKTAVARPLT